MSYGYIGDTSSSIKQQKNNAGVLSVSDVLDLESKGLNPFVNRLIIVPDSEKKPSGSKDPFALRRAAIGLLRIVISVEVLLHQRKKSES